MKFIKPEHMTLLLQRCAYLDGMIMLAGRTSDRARHVVIKKLNAAKAELQAQYGEFEQEDGSVLVKHPAFALIYIDEALLDEPIALFFAKTKALSSIKLSVYTADARVLPNGNVVYERRVKLIEAELTQESFACLISITGSDRFPATYRHFNGQDYSYPGDATSQVSRMLMDSANRVPDGFEKWGQDILQLAQARALKGGVLPNSARDELLNTGETLDSWMGSNPCFYAKELAKHMSLIANNVRMEVFAASKLKGNEQ
ncbi:MAG: hypothetical protein RSD49_06765 [Hafnia sp.]